MKRLLTIAMPCVIAFAATSCSEPVYDISTPQAAVDAAYAMIADGRPELLGTLVYIHARDRTFADGVTEASAIENVIEKTSDMLGRLYRVAGKLRQRFPDDIEQELLLASGGQGERTLLTQFLIDPFGLMDQQRRRVTVEDLGDGTAAVLIDGVPAFGFGLQMVNIDGRWKLDVPIDLLQRYRPETREEWSVLASMILSIENALIAFEDELDRDEFHNLAQASRRAGRLLGERVVMQAIIYRSMKEKMNLES